jgi:branched-chain amino acid transport system ATP-binding protein
VKNYTGNLNKDNLQSILLLKDITVNFGGLTALDGVDLEINEKGIRGIIGPNGAGKTTLFNTITGYIKADEGEIKYNGEDLLGLPPHNIARKGIIRTFQLGGIFPEMSALENIMTGYYRKSKTNLLEVALRLKKGKSEEIEIREKALQIMEDFDLSDLAEQRASDLSFGQQRLVEIGRALMSDPELLLSDEPAAGLSSTERYNLIQLLKTISEEKGIYILLADHSMDFVMEICDYITALNYGKKIAEGKPQEIQQNKEVLEAYLGRG